MIYVTIHKYISKRYVVRSIYLQAVTVPKIGPLVTYWLLGQTKETVPFDQQDGKRRASELTAVSAGGARQEILIGHRNLI